MSSIITLEHISKRYKANSTSGAIIHDISLEIKEGEFFVFLGPSGCGKSTLLRIASGLDKDFSGSVVYKEGTGPEDTNFVFQQFALLPWLTVRENIELGLLGRGIPEHKRRLRSNDLLETLDLVKAANHVPHQLSGGMRQRVGIARALATEPRVIFMDEPFSEIDSFTAERLRGELLMLWKAHGLTIVLVSHLISEAIELSDRIAVLSDRPSTIQKILTNPLPRPRNLRTHEAFKFEDELSSLVKAGLKE